MRLLYLRKPSLEVLGRFLSEQAHLDFTYSAVGATAAIPPAGFEVDRTRVELGRGTQVFEAAKDALRRWQPFRLGWVDVWSPNNSLDAGQVVAIMGRALGVWWLNSCRVVFTVDESGSTSRFGFAYGTLPGHVESGEERFLIEWEHSTDRVFYDILAFSKPNHILTRLGHPFARQFQKRFGMDSAAAMVRAVQAGSRTT